MTKSPTKPFHSILYNVLPIALPFALLGHAIWTNRAEIHRVFSRSLDYRLFLLGFVVHLVGLIVSYIRWYRLVRVVKPSFRLNSAILLGFIGSLFNLVIPGAVGGDLIKAAYLVKMDVKRTQAIASMVIDRIIGLLGLFILGGIAGAFMWSSVSNPNVKLLIGLVWTAVAAGFLALTVLFTPMLMSTLRARFKSGGRLAKILDDLRIASSTYRGRLGVVAGVPLWRFSAMAWAYLPFTWSAGCFSSQKFLLWDSIMSWSPSSTSPRPSPCLLVHSGSARRSASSFSVSSANRAVHWCSWAFGS